MVIFRSKLRQHAGQDLQAKVLLVAQPVRSALDDTDLVVQPFDETERNLILGFAVRRETVPVTLDHLREGLVGFQTLPFQLSPPVLEELPCPGLAVVIPQLAEGFFQQVGGVQTLVGRQQQSQVLASAAGEVLRMREQRVLLALREGFL